MRPALFAILCSTLIAACGSHPADAEPFDTMDLCFEDHHDEEGLSVNDAIVVCCLDHPLGAAMTHPSCGNTKAACVAYLTSDPVGTLPVADASAAEIDAACTDYITKKGQ